MSYNTETIEDLLGKIADSLKNIEDSLNAIGGVMEDRMSSGRKY